MKKKTIKQSINVTTIILCTVLVLYSISLFVPFLWTISTSLKDKIDYIEDPLGLPTAWAFSNFKTAFQYFRVPFTKAGVEYSAFMPNMFLNSFLYAFGCAVMGSFTPCVMAYLCAKFPYKFSKVIYSIVVIGIVLPIVGNLPSEIRVATALHTYGSFIGVWIMKSHFLGTYFLIYFATFKGVSKTYTEAACIDGAGNFTIFFRIILPLVRNIIFTIFLLLFIQFWNDYQTPMIYLPYNPVIAYGMYYYSQSTENALSSVPMQMAGCLLMLVPILVLFLVFHKRILGSNITMGGIKE